MKPEIFIIYMLICVGTVHNPQFLDILFLSMDSTVMQEIANNPNLFDEESKEIIKEAPIPEDSNSSSSSSSSSSSGSEDSDSSSYSDALALIFLGFLLPLMFETGLINDIATYVVGVVSWVAGMDGDPNATDPSTLPGPGSGSEREINHFLDSIFGEGFSNTHAEEGMKEFTKELSSCSDPLFINILSLALESLDGTVVKNITNSTPPGDDGYGVLKEIIREAPITEDSKSLVSLSSSSLDSSDYFVLFLGVLVVFYPYLFIIGV